MDKDVLTSQPASSGSIAPRGASRSITAQRRQAMAEERARMLGPRRASPTVLEAGAAQWDREQGARARAEQGRPLASRQTEMPSLSLQRVALRAEDLPPDDEAFWKVYTPPQPQSKGTQRRGRMGGFSVSAFATRLIQNGRAGGGRRAKDPRAQALEEAARHWEEHRKAGTEFGPAA